MGIIHHHDRAIFFGEVAKRGQRPDVTIHGEDAVGDQQFLARLIFHTGELGFSIGNILMLKD